MAFQTGRGVTLAIGTTQAASTQGEFESDSYVTIGELESINEITREHNPVEFANLADSRTRVKRGVEAVSYIEGTYAFDGADTGQDNMVTAFEVASQAADEYNFRIQYNDASSATGAEPTTIYVRGPVMSLNLQEIGNDNVIRQSFRIARNSDWIEVDAT